MYTINFASFGVMTAKVLSHVYCFANFNAVCHKNDKETIYIRNRRSSSIHLGGLINRTIVNKAMYQ